MIGSALQLIEPGFGRAIINLFSLTNPILGAPIVFLLIDLLLITVIIKKRKQKEGKWIFPAILALIVFNQIFLITGGPNLPFFKNFTTWFIDLNLT